MAAPKQKTDSNLEELVPKHWNGMAMLILLILLLAGCVAGFVWGATRPPDRWYYQTHQMPPPTNLVFGLCTVVSILVCFLFPGLKVLKPNEAMVLTLFGKYVGTLKGPGFYFVNPFVSALNPTVSIPETATAKEVASLQ